MALVLSEPQNLWEVHMLAFPPLWSQPLGSQGARVLGPSWCPQVLVVCLQWLLGGDGSFKGAPCGRCPESLGPGGGGPPCLMLHCVLSREGLCPRLSL